MPIYIGTVKPNALYIIFFLSLCLCDFIIPIIKSIKSKTPIQYTSTLMPSDGYKISIPLSIEKNYTHNVSATPSWSITLICSINLILHIFCFLLLMFNPFINNWINYIFAYTLILLVSLIHWLNESMEKSESTKKEVYVYVAELCYSPTNPNYTVVRFITEEGVHYSHAVLNSAPFTINSWHKLSVQGKAVLDILEYNVKYREILITPDKKSGVNTHPLIRMFVLLALMLIMLVGLFKFPPIDILSDIFNVLVIGFIIGSLLSCVPILCKLRRQRILLSIEMHRTLEYVDMPSEFYYVFVMQSKNGKRYYYLSDDKRAVTKHTVYNTRTCANRILEIGDETGKYVKEKDRTEQTVMPLIWIALILIMGGVTCVFLVNLLGNIICGLGFFLLIHTIFYNLEEERQWKK